MNEQLIVDISEIILSVMALLGTVIILLAAWRDLEKITKHRDENTARAVLPSKNANVYTTISLRALPTIFAILSRETLTRALSRHTAHLSGGKTNTRSLPSHRFGVALLTSVGLLIYISLLTYFFYTAAILRSNSLLTLSWFLVSLWLAAIVWSTERLSLSKKNEMTFTIPFMYFVFYVLSFPRLMRSLMQVTTQGAELYKIWLRQLVLAIRLELYSTRF